MSDTTTTTHPAKKWVYKFDNYDDGVAFWDTYRKDPTLRVCWYALIDTRTAACLIVITMEELPNAQA